MKRGKSFYDVYVSKLDDRFPHVKREFPKVTHIGAGMKFEGGLSSVEHWAKRQPDYRNRKHPPRIRIFEV